jgi:hypothetical protein
MARPPFPTPPEPLPVEYVPKPLLFAHVIFNTLVEHAKPEMVALPLQDEIHERLVFRGKFGDVFEDSGASKAYYTPIRQILEDCGAIVMIERGTAYAPTALVVDPGKPPPLAYPKSAGVNVKSPEIEEMLLTLTDDVGTLREKLENVAERIGGLNILRVLEDFERRISRLETGSSGEN